MIIESEPILKLMKSSLEISIKFWKTQISILSQHRKGHFRSEIEECEENIAKAEDFLSSVNQKLENYAIQSQHK